MANSSSPKLSAARKADLFVDPLDCTPSTPEELRTRAEEKARRTATRVDERKREMVLARLQRGNLRLALTFAKAGIYVFPSIGKDHPLVGRYYLRDDDHSPESEADRQAYRKSKVDKGESPARWLGSTRSRKVIVAMWEAHPGAVPCIAGRPNNLLVVDCDRKLGRPDGVANFAAMFEEAGAALPAGPRTVTPSDGRHLFFREDEVHAFGNATGALPGEIDIRGRHGYVVAPGARLMDGRSYMPEAAMPSLIDSAWDDSALPRLPDLLREKLIAANAEATKEHIHREPSPDAPAKELRAAEAARLIRLARPELLPAVDPAHVGAVRDEAPHLFEPVALDPTTGKLPDHSDRRLELARRLLAVKPDATPLDFAALIAEAPGCGRHVMSKPSVGSYDDRLLARDWAQAQTFGPLRGTPTGEGFGVVSDADEAPVSMVSAVEVFKLKARAGTVDDRDCRLLRGQLIAAGASREAAAKAEAMATEVALGLAEPDSLEPPVCESRPAKKGKRKLPLLRADDINTSDDVDAPQLIDGYLEAGAVALFYGKSGSGKSWLALYAAFCIAAGLPFFGREVKQGAVVYAACEGVKGTRNRIRGMMRRHGVKSLPLNVIPARIDLNTAEGVRAVKDAIAETEADYGQKVVLVVADTLAKAMGDGNENEARDVNRLNNHVTDIQSETGATVALIHHTGKEQERGPRGSSSLLASVDQSYEVTSSGAGLKATMTVKSQKQRDGDEPDRLSFGLEAFSLGANADGTPKMTAVLVPRVVSDETATAPKVARPIGPKLSDTETEVLRQIEGLSEVGPEIGTAELLTEINESRKADFGPEAKLMSEQMLRKMLAGLDEKNQIERSRGLVRLIGTSNGFSVVDDEDDDDAAG